MLTVLRGKPVKRLRFASILVAGAILAGTTACSSEPPIVCSGYTSTFNASRTIKSVKYRRLVVTPKWKLGFGEEFAGATAQLIVTTETGHKLDIGGPAPAGKKTLKLWLPEGHQYRLYVGVGTTSGTVVGCKPSREITVPGQLAPNPIPKPTPTSPLQTA